MLTAALIAVAFVAGLAGAWSPCGLSMVETLAPDACGGRRQTSAAGALAFAAGALAGGVVTFGGLAALGAAAGAGGGLAAAVAAAALLVAAVGDAAGRRILPQVRRQVPESWRRVLPVPVAAGLYGVLLGLGFTTFVLSFATWGLAAACLAVGAPATGTAVGLAFGAGRTLPVVALAPLQDRERAADVAAAMGERPVVLRGLRAAAAAGLAVAAVALAVAPPAARATSSSVARTGTPARAGATAQTAIRAAADPSVSGPLVAWQGGDGTGYLSRAGEVVALAGTNPAVAGTLVAWVEGEQVVVADAATLVPTVRLPAPGADAVALSDRIVAWRTSAGGRDRVLAQDLLAPAPQPVLVATAARGGSLGRPSATGTQVLFDAQERDRSRIVAHDVASDGQRTLRQAQEAVLLAPSAAGSRLLYVRSTAARQQLRLGPFATRRGSGGDRFLYGTTPTARRDSGHEPGLEDHHQGYPGGRRPPAPARPPKGVTVTLWTTALAPDAAYVTRLRHFRGGRVAARILRVER